MDFKNTKKLSLKMTLRQRRSLKFSSQSLTVGLVQI